MNGVVRVEGLKELQRAFNRADREEGKALRHEIKQAAGPVKNMAEARAVTRIRRMHRSPRWAVMRLGYAKNLVYMVPRQKGTHGRGARRRPNLTNLLLDRAMIPAMEANRARTEQAVQHMLDTIGRQWERNL